MAKKAVAVELSLPHQAIEDRDNVSVVVLSELRHILGGTPPEREHVNGLLRA
jgi:hypothetical protein